VLVTCAGILVVDLIAANLPKVSEPGELTFAPNGIEVHTGGHPGNVSIDLRKLGLKQGEVSCIAAVGEDIFGDFLQSVLKQHDIITHLQRVHGVATSKNLILVVKGEDRRFHHDNGTNWFLSPEYVLPIVEKEEPLIFYVGGGGLLGEFDEQLPEVLQRAKKNGCLTFTDPVKPYKGGWDFIIPALRWTDIFHCNNDEAESITGKANSKEAAKVLVDKGASLVIISLGERGLIAKTKECLYEMPAFKVPVVDPSGAGDALCAGIIHGLLRRGDYKRCYLSDLSAEELANILLEGEAAGAACVTMVGTTTGVTEENVNRILREQGTMISRYLRINPA